MQGSMTLADQPRLIGLTLAETWRRGRRRVRSSAAAIFNLSGTTPDSLLLAPQDLRTADPIVAKEIYSGKFTLADHIVFVEGETPFSIKGVDEEWRRQLNAFRWIRHLSQIESTLAKSHAKSLVREWIKLNPKPKNTLEWDIEVTSNRLISWICHSVVILEDADLSFYRAFLKNIGRHIRWLKIHALDAPDGKPRLLAFMALNFAAVCLSRQNYSLRHAKRKLDMELERQIFNDGGHISRNPALLVDILADLLPLRQAYYSIDEPPSDLLVASIDRMMTALRFFRHRNGSLAHFNGANLSRPELLTTVLRYDETLGTPASSFSSSGFERMEGGQATTIMDVGLPPKGPISINAGAGTLAFELSCQNELIVLNCGASVNPPPRIKNASRSTAAHSTLAMNNTSSSRFELSGPIGNYLKGQIISCPSKVDLERSDGQEKSSITASHDGYLRQFGIIHERSLSLTKDGLRLYGSDRVFEPLEGNPSGRDPIDLSPDLASIRFHLHPRAVLDEIKELSGGACSVQFEVGGAQIWRFISLDAPITLQESMFFGSYSGPRSTTQIVIDVHVCDVPRLRWAFERLH